jgi:hypothetical protein
MGKRSLLLYKVRDKIFNLLIYSVEILVRKAASGGLKHIEEL